MSVKLSIARPCLISQSLKSLNKLYRFLMWVVDTKGCHQNWFMIEVPMRCRRCRGHSPVWPCGVLLSVVECCGLCWLVTSTSKKSPHLQKVTSTLKSKKKVKKNPIFFFLLHFVTKMLRKCFINPQTSHYCSKKSKK